MSPDEKKALDRYINDTEKRVAQWFPAQRDAFLKATGGSVSRDTSSESASGEENTQCH